MPNVSRLLATWQGFQGAPGYSRFSFEEITSLTDADTAGSYIHTFFSSLVGMLHSNWTITISPIVENFDVSTGRLVSELTMSSPPAAIPGQASPTAVYQGGAGAVVHWLTGAIFNGRRVRGRTYLVPLVGVGDSDGSIDQTHLATIQSAATALANAALPSLTVWAKSFSNAVPPVQTGGLNPFVSIGTVPDKTAIMRSRRD